MQSLDLTAKPDANTNSCSATIPPAKLSLSPNNHSPGPFSQFTTSDLSGALGPFSASTCNLNKTEMEVQIQSATMTIGASNHFGSGMTSFHHQKYRGFSLHPRSLLDVKMQPKYAVGVNGTDFVEKVEASVSENGVMNDAVNPKSEVIVKREEITLSMSEDDEQTALSLLEEKPCVEESKDVKTDNKWALQLNFGKEFADQLMEEALETIFDNESKDNRFEKENHKADKPLTYLQCPCFSKQSSHHQGHLQMHTGEKSFICLQCPKSFSSSNDLKLHLRTHTVEKTFKCLQCPKSFRQSTHLKRHLQFSHFPQIT